MHMVSTQRPWAYVLQPVQCQTEATLRRSKTYQYNDKDRHRLFLRRRSKRLSPRGASIAYNDLLATGSLQYFELAALPFPA